MRKTHTGRDGCLLRKLARGAGARVISKLLVFFIKSKPDQVLGPGPWGRLRGPSRRLVPSWGYPGAGRPGPSAWGRASWPLRARSAAAEPPPRRIAVLARAVPALPVTPLLGRLLCAPAPGRPEPNHPTTHQAKNQTTKQPNRKCPAEYAERLNPPALPGRRVSSHGQN